MTGITSSFPVHRESRELVYQALLAFLGTLVPPDHVVYL